MDIVELKETVDKLLDTPLEVMLYTNLTDTSIAVTVTVIGYPSGTTTVVKGRYLRRGTVPVQQQVVRDVKKYIKEYGNDFR